MKFTTTLKKIRENYPCREGWQKLLKHLGKTAADDEPLPLLTVLDANGLDDAIWCMCAMPEHDREWRLFAVWCARQVQHLLDDPRSIHAIDIAEKYANGEASAGDLTAARAAAWDAARAAAGTAARDSARDAARDSARAAAWDAAWAAAWAAARDAALAAARYSARAAARDAQEAELRRILTGGRR